MKIYKNFSTPFIERFFKIDKIKNILDRNNLKYQLYENYSTNEATDESKNIEIAIKKRKLIYKKQPFIVNEHDMLNVFVYCRNVRSCLF